jgi:transcriptional regulator with XRE-family HTH domain
MSDKTLTRCVGAFVRHHRMELNKSQDVRASEAGISRSTQRLLERSENYTYTSNAGFRSITGIWYVTQSSLFRPRRKIQFISRVCIPKTLLT